MDMTLCKCIKCSKSTNGIGKIVHRTTAARHIKNEERDQDLLENSSEGENLSEEPEERNLDNEEQSSPMEISDNEEVIPIGENLTILHNDETSMEILTNFQDEEEDLINDSFYYYESDNINYDSQNESEFDDTD